MRLSMVVFGLILITTLTISFSGIIGDIANNYDVINDETSLSTFSKINQTNTLVKDITENFNTNRPNNILEQIGYLTSKAFATISIVLNSIPIVSELIQNSFTLIGIPPEYALTATTIFELAVIFGIAAIILRWFV